MGDLRVGAWALLAAGCGAVTTPAPTPEPAGECVPTASGTSALRLRSIAPDVVPLHGGDVELAFDGGMPDGAPIYVDGVAATIDGTTLHVPASLHGIGPLSIRIGGDAGDPVASLACAGHYAEAPDSVTLTQSPAGLAVPLHPELAHACARIGYVDIANTGDAPFVIYPELTGSPGFEPLFPPDECPLPMYFDSCRILMCFSSTISTTHSAHLVIPSTMTTGALDFTATVLPPTPGLDVAMWRPYTTPAREQVRGLATLPAGGFAVWDEAPAQTFETVTAAGASTRRWIGAVSIADASVVAMRAGAAGQGIYAIVGDATQRALIHFDDAGLRDTAFGELAVPGDATAIAVTPSRVLAIAATRAVDATGAAVDFSAYGAFTGASAVDDTGRVYVATASGVVRIAGDAIDPTFHYAGAVAAMTFAGGVIVASGRAVARLDDTGAATLVPLAVARAITDVAVDDSGRLLVVTDDGQLARFAATGELDGVKGFDGTHRVACPAAGDCAAVGLANRLDKYLVALAP